MTAVPKDFGVHEDVQAEIETDAQAGVGALAYEWTPSDEDEATVERYLSALRYYREELVNADRLYALALADLQERDLAFRKDAVGAVAYLEARLRQFSECVGRVRRKSPSGTIGWTKGKLRIEVDEEFCERHADSPFVRWKSEPDKVAIKEAIEDTGEIPEGADQVRGEDTFNIALPK